MQHHNNNAIRSDDLLKTINDLVTEGEIIELEYVLPNMDYRIKSIYFPKGTIFPRDEDAKTNS